jgi:hypothetical protein
VTLETAPLSPLGPSGRPLDFLRSDATTLTEYSARFHADATQKLYTALKRGYNLIKRVCQKEATQQLSQPIEFTTIETFVYF